MKIQAYINVLELSERKTDPKNQSSYWTVQVEMKSKVRVGSRMIDTNEVKGIKSLVELPIGEQIVDMFLFAPEKQIIMRIDGLLYGPEKFGSTAPKQKT